MVFHEVDSVDSSNVKCVDCIIYYIIYYKYTFIIYVYIYYIYNFIYIYNYYNKKHTQITGQHFYIDLYCEDTPHFMSKVLDPSCENLVSWWSLDSIENCKLSTKNEKSVLICDETQFLKTLWFLRTCHSVGFQT